MNELKLFNAQYKYDTRVNDGRPVLHTIAAQNIVEAAKLATENAPKDMAVHHISEAGEVHHIQGLTGVVRVS